MSLFLSPAELAELTGYTQHAKQSQSLVSMGLQRGRDYYVRPDGRPMVVRARLEGGVEPPSVEPLRLVGDGFR